MIKTLNHTEIEQRLPHSGNMCLLHEVIQTDDTSLTALATSHLDSNNPLRLNDTISSVNGIEYAAQAMAVRGSLLYDSPQAGYIATVRNIEIHKPFLIQPHSSTPLETSPLIIKVEQLMSNDSFPPEKIRQMVPMQHPGEASEVASLVSFLTSDEAAYISGQQAMDSKTASLVFDFTP
ncbi:MAG: hypothetical protein GY694_11430 [Gammaproteobacteria bacterium]|nr:hypothetical protein [Gammaproteobacteria bacterium]